MLWFYNLHDSSIRLFFLGNSIAIIDTNCKINYSGFLFCICSCYVFRLFISYWAFICAESQLLNLQEKKLFLAFNCCQQLSWWLDQYSVPSRLHVNHLLASDYQLHECATLTHKSEIQLGYYKLRTIYQFMTLNKVTPRLVSKIISSSNLDKHI
jgi:hypothetical protein